MARGLAPVGRRSGPGKATAAAQPNGGKPPRHRVMCLIYRVAQPLSALPAAAANFARRTSRCLGRRP
ncbi:hypothetical protein C9I49_15935 [Pseudomonas prosekii]|uniref:Uncharacterized protein n=1 Tax=Pseudomonas prosekii TaxID=1148509 RepID=A0A2U2D6H6_9PSED|nr:hypothetical protein C9I49_15935 [Pseudomonas prosekii]